MKTPTASHKHKALHDELHAWLAGLPRSIDEDAAKAYLSGGTSTLRFLGLKTPVIDSVRKAPLRINALEGSEAVDAWFSLWETSPIFEALTLAQSHFTQKKLFSRALEHWPLFKKMVERIENWAHSDTLSKLVAACVEADAKLVLPTLRTWNASNDPWKQRQSVVGLLYYAQARKACLPFETLLPFVERLLENDHFYVKKGVGWTLREMHNVYPKETYAYLEANIHRLSAYAFSASTEKMTAARKARLKAKRLAARTAKRVR